MLSDRGIEVGDAHLVVFGREGFDVALKRVARRREDVHLIDLADLYGARTKAAVL